MTTSYNGFPASTDPKFLGITKLVVGGVEFVGGVKGGDVLTVLGHVAHEFNARVEPLHSPGCWGYSYRQNRNANNLSNHSSGTAIDCNAPKHPNGVEASKTFTKTQIATVHKILAEVPELAEVVHWGGDWHPPLTPDSMHFEIHDHDTAKLARVAKRIKETAVPTPKPTKPKSRGANVDQAIARLNKAARVNAHRPFKLRMIRTALAALNKISAK